MPNFDKTGPQGKGKRTGRGFGSCSVNPEQDGISGGMGRGQGQGQGRGGSGRGAGRKK